MLNIKSKEEFYELSKKGALVVDFYADWCGPCRMLSPVMEELASQYEGKATFAKLNVDNVDEIPSLFNIRSIPCVIFIKDGKEVNRIVGFRPRKEFEIAIESL